MADPEAIAKAFSDHYYNTFDSNRAALGSLYQDTSLLTFEGSKVQGAQAIMQKLTSLPFQTEGEANALKFSQIFHLAPVGGSWVITNDLFRLNYA